MSNTHLPWMKLAATVFALVAVVPAAVRASRRPRWPIRGLFLFALGAFFACGSPADQNDNSRDALPSAFLTPVAAAEQSGLTVYWLGDTLSVSDLVFRVGGADLKGAGGTPPLRYEYNAELADGGTVGLTFYLSGEGTYEEAVQRQVAKPLRMTRRDTTIRAWPAASFGIAAGRWTNQQVIVGAPGSVVVVAANASIVNGRQVNPLDDPDLLVQVLNENLRPYPE